MRASSLFTSFTFCNFTSSCSLLPKENTHVPFTCVSLKERLATINLHYNVIASSLKVLCNDKLRLRGFLFKDTEGIKFHH